LATSRKKKIILRNDFLPTLGQTNKETNEKYIVK